MAGSLTVIANLRSTLKAEFTLKYRPVLEPAFLEAEAATVYQDGDRNRAANDLFLAISNCGWDYLSPDVDGFLEILPNVGGFVQNRIGVLPPSIVHAAGGPTPYDN